MLLHTAQHAVTYLLILQKLQEVLIIFFETQILFLLLRCCPIWVILPI